MFKEINIYGLVCQGVYFVLATLSLLDYGCGPVLHGKGLGFTLYFISLLPVFLSIIFYLFAALVNFSKKHWLSMMLLLILAIAGLPILFWFGLSGQTLDIIVWNGYYILLFVFNLVFVMKAKTEHAAAED